LKAASLNSYLHAKRIMEYGKKRERNMPRCLECGQQIRYGRTDKKFCSEDCRVRHHNNVARDSRGYRRRILSILSRNYEILDELLCAGVDSIELTDILLKGFVPGIVTSYHKVRRREEYSCFDIKYIMTATRVCCISKIQNVSVHLHSGINHED